MHLPKQPGSWHSERAFTTTFCPARHDHLVCGWSAGCVTPLSRTTAPHELRLQHKFQAFVSHLSAFALCPEHWKTGQVTIY